MQFTESKDFILKKLASELPSKLSYHSVDHIKDVYQASDYLLKHEGVDGEDMQLVLTAALYHDSGFLFDAEGHETLSCDIVRKYLPQFDYNAQEVEQVCSMIMATKLPQSPKNKLEEILCDADLDYLGREDFYTTGAKLYNEFLSRDIVKNEGEWNKVQLQFLEQHRYFTNTATKLRKEKKDEHLRQIRTKVEAST
jgi:uncharacterized protein